MRFKEIFDEDHDNIIEWFSYGARYIDNDKLVEHGLLDLQIEALHDEGDCEGGGEHSEMVRKITYPDGYSEIVRVEGYYASYVGTDWNWSQMHLCKPVEKMITVYEPI